MSNQNSSPNKGEVWWGWFPFQEDTSRGKDRPMVVVGVDGDKVAVAAIKVTSSPPFDPLDFRLQDWKEANLFHESTACPSSLRMISIKALRRKVGSLSHRDWHNTILRLDAFLEQKNE